MQWLKTLHRPALVWAIAFGIAFVMLGIVLLLEYDTSHRTWQKLIGLFTSELGFALLIAVTIFVVLEEEATREHSRSVVGYLYNVDPDGKFFRKIEEYILKRTFYRGKTVVTYRFLEKEGEAVFIKYIVEYSVKNVSREPQEFEVKGIVDKKPIHAGPARWDADLGISQVELNDDEVPKDNFTITKGSNSDQCQVYKVKAIKLQPGCEARVKVVHFVEKHDHDSEVWQTSIPCSAAELRVEWPDDFGLKFAVEAIHPEPSALKMSVTENKLKVSLNEPFMAHYGIHFWWSRNSASAAAGTQAPATSQPAPAGP